MKRAAAVFAVLAVAGSSVALAQEKAPGKAQMTAMAAALEKAMRGDDGAAARMAASAKKAKQRAAQGVESANHGRGEPGRPRGERLQQASSRPGRGSGSARTRGSRQHS